MAVPIRASTSAAWVTSQLHGQCDVVTAQLLGGDLGRLEVHVAEHHPRAFRDESLGDGETQTLGTARDHRSLTAQQRHLDHASLSVLAPTRAAIDPISYFI